LLNKAIVEDNILSLNY